MQWIFRRIAHFFGVHRYFVLKELSPETRKLGCRFCSKKWIMNDRVQLVGDWDYHCEKRHEQPGINEGNR